MTITKVAPQDARTVTTRDRPAFRPMSGQLLRPGPVVLAHCPYCDADIRLESVNDEHECACGLLWWSEVRVICASRANREMRSSVTVPRHATVATTTGRSVAKNGEGAAHGIADQAE